MIHVAHNGWCTRRIFRRKCFVLAAVFFLISCGSTVQKDSFQRQSVTSNIPDSSSNQKSKTSNISQGPSSSPSISKSNNNVKTNSLERTQSNSEKAITLAETPASLQIKNYLLNSKHEDGEKAWDRFDFALYLKSTPFIDLQQITQHGAIISSLNVDVQLFYLKLAEAFLRYYPFSISGLFDKCKIAERYVNSGNLVGVTRDDREVFQSIGYFMLYRVALIFEEQHWTKDAIESNSERKAVYDLLRRNKVHVTLAPPGRIKKCIGDLSRCVTRVSDLIGTKIGKLFGESKSSQITVNLYPSVRLAGSHLYSLSKNGKEIGTVLVASRNQTGVGYLATKARNGESLDSKAIQRVKSLNSSMIALTAGGFTSSAGTPEGLTFQDGQVVNAALGPAHALVIVKKDGAIIVADLNDEFYLPGITAPLSPRIRLIDYYRLTGWLKKNRGSAFQTYLLAHGNSFLLDQDKVPLTVTERRFFGAIRDKRSGELQTVLVNMPASSNLFTAARDTFTFLTSISGNPKKIEFLVYLDVGAFDILQLYDVGGKVIPQIQGKKDPAIATNLLYLYSK